MAATKHTALGCYPIESFDMHDTGGEHATRSTNDLHEFLQLASSSGAPELMNRKLARDIYLHNHGGYFFRSLMHSVTGTETNRSLLMAGVTINHNEKQNSSEVTASYARSGHAGVDDSLHYLWARKIIPRFSFTRFLPSMYTTGINSNKIVIPHIPDEASLRLVQTFGYCRNDVWTIPLPSITLTGASSELTKLLDKVRPPDDIDMAYYADDTEIVTYYNGGEQVAELTKGTRIHTADGNSIDVSIPALQGDMEQLFASPSVQAQLGYVTLKRCAYVAD